MAAAVGAGPGAVPWADADCAGVAGGGAPTQAGQPPRPQQCVEAATQLVRNANRATKSGPFSFRIRKGAACVEAGTKKGPMVAKHPPLASASLPTTPVSADPNMEAVKLVTPSSRCRTPPLPRCRTPPAIPGSDMGEGIRPRRRSPSITRSRPSSPGGGGSGHRRVPSPCSLDPVVLEAVRRRVSRIAQARLYLLSQPGPNSFVVGGDSPDHKYRVTVGPQTCSCGRGPHCLHLLFVMLRVFQVPESDSRIYLRELKNFEVESLFQTFEERRNSRAAGSRPENCRKNSSPLHRTAPGPLPGSAADGRSSTEAAFTAQTNDAVEEDLCPICLLEMVDGESLVSCATGCRNKLHHHCMAIWAVECDHQGELVLCPLCRRPWQEETAPARSILSNPAAISFNHHTVLSHFPPDSTRRSIPSSPHATPKLRSPSANQPPPFPGPTPPQGPQQSYGRHMPAGQPPPFTSKAAGQPPLTPKAVRKPHPPSAGRAAEHKPAAEFRRCGTPSPVSSSPMVSFRSFPAAHKAAPSISGNSHLGQDVPVPHAGSIPAEQMLIAGEWIKVFGFDVVSCLYSRDWKAREWALRQLVAQLVTAHQQDDEELQRTVVRCCAKILTGVAADPVFKVYAGCVRGCRVLLSYASSGRHSGVPELREVIRRIVRILLVKCADRNRRTSQLTTEVLVEFARGENGDPSAVAGRNALAMSPGSQATFLDGVELVLGCVLEDWCYESTSWQWLAGRLVVLDRLVRDLPNEFALQYVQLRAAESSGYKLRNYDRLISVVEFALKALHSTHGTVSKLARHVFVVSASMASVEHGVLAQVVGMLAGLEPALQARLKKRLQVATDGGSGQGGSAPASTPSPLAARHKTVRAAAVATLNQPGITERRYSSKAEPPPPRPHCSACGHAKAGPVLAARSPPGSPALRPRDLALDLSYPRSKTPVKFQHPQPPAKRWGTSGSRLYNLFTRNKKLEEVLPSRPDLCSVPAKYSDSVETSSTCSFSAASSPTEAPGSGLTTPGQESLADYLEDFAEELIIPLNVDELNCPADWDLPPVPGLQGPDELQQTDINSQEQNMEGGLKKCSMYSEGKNWKRGHLLGTGAFSTCYQARDVTTGALMAVKQVAFCRPAAKDQALVETGIREEIVTMRRLRHANVVRLLGATKQDGHFNVFVEWMAGGSVAAMLEKYGPFGDGVIVSYTKQILDGLAYLHDNHILHRDLKGANLLVDGTGRHLRIGDFGSSARLASHATATGEFQNKVFGTTAFMAPEVLRGESYGRSCDVWSVGCCMIEMASSKPPWKEKCVSNHYALMYKIASSEDPPYVPNTLDWTTKDLALHCLRLNSKLRPSAKELLRHICFQGM